VPYGAGVPFAALVVFPRFFVASEKVTNLALILVVRLSALPPRKPVRVTVIEVHLVFSFDPVLGRGAPNQAEPLASAEEHCWGTVRIVRGRIRSAGLESRAQASAGRG
jgi:hypothetical protein